MNWAPTSPRGSDVRRTVHHGRRPVLSEPVLQQLSPDLPGPGLRRHRERDDARNPNHSARPASSCRSQDCAVARGFAGMVGRRYARGRDGTIQRQGTHPRCHSAPADGRALRPIGQQHHRLSTDTDGPADVHATLDDREHAAAVGQRRSTKWPVTRATTGWRISCRRRVMRRPTVRSNGRGVLPLLDDLLAEPLLKADLAESRAVGRHERVHVEDGAEIARAGVGHHFARVQRMR